MSTFSSPPASAIPTFSPHHAFMIGHRDRTERVVIASAPVAVADHIERSIDAWLTVKERERITRAVAKRRREFILGRYVAKTALAVWNGRPAITAFAIEPGAFEQPVVIGDSAADVTIAHTAEAAVAVAHDRGHPIGVDLEKVDPERIDVLRSQISTAELPAARSLLESEATRLFLIWSAKEALSKALRCGLTCPFALLAVAEAVIDARGICTGTFVNFSQYQFTAWMIEDQSMALVCSRNATLEPALTDLVRFTRKRTSP